VAAKREDTRGREERLVEAGEAVRCVAMERSAQGGCGENDGTFTRGGPSRRAGIVSNGDDGVGPGSGSGSGSRIA